ncbi:MAG: DNA-3-methyladenine glycosylase, partial [Chloroflexi bacterium]|nr:DNA-3-methyladenine glycosylase [Chloroflexota bacterium]
LLGHWLVRQTAAGPCVGVMVETEAYLDGDPACHAYGGETARNRAMWGDPGRAYIYLIYGFHCCFNTVCCPSGKAEAVLVRAVEPHLGWEFLRANRPVSQDLHLTSGPGKLCAAMSIDRSFDGADLCDAASPLFVAENPDREQFVKKRGPMLTAPRIGLSRAADLPLRFFLQKSPFVSRKVPVETGAGRGRQRRRAQP